MSETNVDILDRTIQQTNAFLKLIEQEFGWIDEPEIAYDALAAVLHTLRDRLTVEEAADFASQLPLLIKGVFYEEYKPSKMPVKMDRDAFFNAVRQKFPLSMEYQTEELVRGVLHALGTFVSQGEMKDVKTTLPKDLAALI